MPEFYFSRFPVIEYGDDQLKCVNIAKNIALNPNLAGRPVLFYPYEIQHNMRPDVVSYGYYNDSYLEWLIFLANGILDPYYDWYLSDEDFIEFIKKKYGSIEEAQQKVRHYAINWPDDTKEISVSHYQDILPEALKKYYSAYFGKGTKILHYRRRQEDWVINTNQLVRLEITLNANTGFSNGERVLVKNSMSTATVGNGEVIIANSSVVKIQHITGNTSANQILTGLSSNAFANVINQDILDKVIPDEEFVYWTPTYYFDWERERNERNKNIYLIDAQYTLPLVEERRKKLQE
jgi:hypothetical protein